MDKAKDYLVSVITPFHNVDLEFFRRSFASLQAQTLGFDNIQWIVVLHNTEEKYHREVQKLLGGLENVLLKRLDNQHLTPSSPRNYGMKFATAPYLGFLDGDDCYTPACLETSISRMKSTSSQMVVFRREFEMDREGLMPLTEIVLWDQTREEIVVDREHWDDERMFVGVWGMVTSRLYDRLFLDKYGIIFDENVPYLEDCLFLIEAYGRVDRVCYLPQFIGYHYLIHGGSMVQSMAEKSGEELISYAEGYKIIFDRGHENGIYIDDLMAHILTALADVMARSEKLTLRDRQQIKNILEPYVHMIPMLPVSKVTTEQEAQLLFKLPREVILHPENFDQGQHMQNIWNGEGLLLDILNKNQATDYGRRYHFSVLRTAEGYRKRVPLSEYAVYEPLVNLQMRIGESAIFSAEPIYCYLLSDSPQGAPRLIPATRSHMKPYLESFTQAVQDRTTFLLVESLPMRQHSNDGAVLNSVNGMVLADFLQKQRNSFNAMEAHFTSPASLLLPTEAVDTLYLRLLFALKERQVEQIMAPYTWGILEAMDFLKGHWQELCNDLEQGRITFNLDVPPAFLKGMEALLQADPERAEELRQIFRQGFGEPVAGHIWPRLSRILAFGSGDFAIYSDRLKAYMGDIHLDNGNLALPEGLIGLGIKGTDSFSLTEGESFYEFRPLEGGEPLLLGQVQEGQCYELVITNQAGLYRYATGEIIRVEKTGKGRLTFKTLGNSRQSLSMGDFSLRGEDIYTAIKEAAGKYRQQIADFAFYQEDGCLKILLEADDSLALTESLLGEETVKLTTALDAELQKIHPGYAAARQDALPPCRLAWNQPQTHLLYRDLLRFRYKTAPDHVMPVRCLEGKAQVGFFKRMLA